MLETIDARTDLARPTSALRDWTYRRNSRAGVETWTMPSPPDGVSMVSVSSTPDGYRLRLEGNLITALHGPRAAAGTLDPSEVPEAVSALLGTAEAASGLSMPDPHRWDVHRLDPSRTVHLPPDLSASEVVTAALASWSVLPHRNVTTHKRETVTRQINKWRSHTIYDKTADLRHKGQTCPPGLLRLEARLRPRNSKAEAWASFRPSLAFTAADLETAMRETDLIAESVNNIAATGDLMLIRALTKAGCPHNTALRIAGVTRLVTAFGPDILTEGVGAPDRTAARWIAEVRQWQTAITEDSLADELSAGMKTWTTLKARDVAAAPGDARTDRKARSAGTERAHRESAADRDLT